MTIYRLLPMALLLALALASGSVMGQVLLAPTVPPPPTVAPATLAPKPVKLIESNLDRPRPASLIAVFGGFGLPAGQLASRFGGHATAGASYTYLWPKKWALTLEGAFGFGNRLKQDPLTSLRDSTGILAGANGNPATITLTERFYLLPTLKVGKLFIVRRKRKPLQFEHALLLQAGASYLAYQYGIEDVAKTVPLLDKTNKRGYDRLTGGPALLLEATYMLFAPNSKYSFFASLQLVGSVGKSLRKFDFGTGSADTKTYASGMCNLRVGLSINIFKLDDKDYFYN